VLATIAGARTLNLVHDGVGSAAALAGGYHLAWFIGAATIGITLVLTMTVLRARRSLEGNDDLAEDEAVA
jgi:hypothetical protein